LNIIAGENGCGKTTILKMIDYIIKNDFISLSLIPFESVEFTINGEKHLIDHSDLDRIEFSKNPAFRFAVKESLKESTSFEQFYDRLIKKAESFKEFKVCFEPPNYEYLPLEYFKEDHVIYEIDNYEKLMSKAKTIFGSKYYLKQVFNAYYNKNVSLISYAKIKTSTVYSFIDLDKRFDDFNKINVFDKAKIVKKLKIKMPNKEFKFKNNTIEVYNKSNMKKIENNFLSAGEKKLIQFYKSLSVKKKKHLLLLDEPELSLSYLWVDDLLETLKKFSKKTKIIIATQHPLIKKEEDLEKIVPIL
jgi:energy-coupling factor transporter ATP-binding protein EcfA2